MKTIGVRVPRRVLEALLVVRQSGGAPMCDWAGVINECRYIDPVAAMWLDNHAAVWRVVLGAFDGWVARGCPEDTE